MCTLCVIGWDSEAEKFRSICKECRSAKDCKGKNAVRSATTTKKRVTGKHAKDNSNKKVRKKTPVTKTKSPYKRGSVTAKVIQLNRTRSKRATRNSKK